MKAEEFDKRLKEIAGHFTLNCKVDVQFTIQDLNDLIDEYESNPED